MILKLFNFVFGKIIGLDSIPKEKRERFIKEVAVPVIKKAVISYIESEGKEVNITYEMRF